MSLVDRIQHAIKSNNPFFSLEFFPPRSTEGFRKLTARIKRMCKLEPMFINITWRTYADRAHTLGLCDWVHNKLGIEVMMHLTCVGLTQLRATKVLDAVKRSGVRNLLVLRGDNNNNGEASSGLSSKGDFPFAKDLVKFIRTTYGTYFAIAVAGFPEGPHNPGQQQQQQQQRASSTNGSTGTTCATPSARSYFDHLKDKVDAGASLILTQACTCCDLWSCNQPTNQRLSLPFRYGYSHGWVLLAGRCHGHLMPIRQRQIDM